MSIGPFDYDEPDYFDAILELEAEDAAYADNFSIEDANEPDDETVSDVATEYTAALQAEETPPRGPVRIDIEARIANAVRSGERCMVILAAIGPAKPPRYAYPPAAIEGDTLELYADGERLFPDVVIRVSSTQALSMERSSRGIFWSQCGRETAAFPLYSAEETALTAMDGWPDDAARFAHYCPDNRRFQGHIIRWESAP